MTVFNKTLSVTFWFQIATQILKVFKILIFGYYLQPYDLGLFAIIGIFIFLLESFSKTGTSDYLIAKEGAISDDEFNNAWTIDFIKNISLFILATIFAPTVGEFFNVDIVDYINLYSCVFIFNAIRNNRVLIFQKELMMSKYLLYNFIPLLFGLIFNLYLFHLGLGLYAVILALLFQSFLLFILSFYFKRNSVSFLLDKEITYDQLNFGKWIFLQTINDFIYEKFDRFFLAKYFAPSWLGNYQFSASLTSDVQFQFRNFCRTALFPLFSKEKSLLNRKKNYSIFLFKYTLLALVGMFLVMFLYDDVIQFLYENKWDSTINIIAFLALFTYSNNLVISTESIFLSEFKPKIYFNVNLIKCIVYISLMVSFVIMYGEDGLLYSLFISSIINFFIFYFLVLYYDLMIKKFLFFSFLTSLIITIIFMVFKLQII